MSQPQILNLSPDSCSCCCLFFPFLFCVCSLSLPCLIFRSGHFETELPAPAEPGDVSSFLRLTLPCGAQSNLPLGEYGAEVCVLPGCPFAPGAGWATVPIGFPQCVVGALEANQSPLWVPVTWGCLTLYNQRKKEETKNYFL